MKPKNLVFIVAFLFLASSIFAQNAYEVCRYVLPKWENILPCIIAFISGTCFILFQSRNKGELFRIIDICVVSMGVFVLGILFGIIGQIAFVVKTGSFCVFTPCFMISFALAFMLGSIDSLGIRSSVAAAIGGACIGWFFASGLRNGYWYLFAISILLILSGIFVGMCYKIRQKKKLLSRIH